MPLDIPGYYYDQGKDRYFKILPGHKAPGGQSHEYSSESVKSKEKIDNSLKKKKKQRRNDFRGSGGSYGSTWRDGGGAAGSSRGPLLHVQALASTHMTRWRQFSVLREAYSDRMALQCTVNSSVPSRMEDSEGIEAIAHVQASGTSIGVLRAESKWLTFGLLGGGGGKEVLNPQACIPTGSLISHISTEGVLVLTTSLGEPPQGASARLYRIGFSDHGVIDSQDPDISQTTEWRPPLTALWSGALKSSQIALGAEKKVFFIPDSEVERLESSNDYATGTKVLRTESDALSIRFSNDGHQLFAGLRDGRVHSWDVRTEHDSYWSRQDEGDYPRGDVIRAPSSVVDMRLIQDWYLVCSCLNGAINMYDLRFCPKPSTQQPKMSDPKTRLTAGHVPNWSSARKATRPVLSFRGHSNEYQRNLGFDIDPSEQFVAAAGDDKIVRMWSIRDGQPLESTASQSSESFNALLNTPFRSPIRALTFTDYPKDHAASLQYHPRDPARFDGLDTTPELERWLARRDYESSAPSPERHIGNELGIWVATGRQLLWYGMKTGCATSGP